MHFWHLHQHLGGGERETLCNGAIGEGLKLELIVGFSKRLTKVFVLVKMKEGY